MTDNEPLLRSGVNFTNRAELKYARAAHLANELRGRIDEWSAAETLLARVHQVDEHTVEFRMVVKQAPPIDEWSLILGDAVHNLRSAFDNLIWAIANLDGATPKSPGRVTFPTTVSQQEWEQRAKQLESVSLVFLERVRRLQPWADGLAGEESMLWLLHHFDIVDKHRGLIAGRPYFRQLSIAGLDLNFKPAETAGAAVVSHSLRQVPVAIQNEAVLTTIRSTTHTIEPDPSYLAKVEVQFFIDWDEVRVLPLDTFLPDLLNRTREWLD